MCSLGFALLLVSLSLSSLNFNCFYFSLEAVLWVHQSKLVGGTLSNIYQGIPATSCMRAQHLSMQEFFISSI